MNKSYRIDCYEPATTPVILARDISSQVYVGGLETGGEYWEVVKIDHCGGIYFVAGVACNTGLIASYARLVDEYESADEALQGFAADLADLEYPSDDLLQWNGSMVI